MTWVAEIEKILSQRPERPIKSALSPVKNIRFLVETSSQRPQQPKIPKRLNNKKNNQSVLWNQGGGQKSKV